MTLAHVAGMPFEEWIAPLVATGSSLALTLRLAVQRRRDRTSTRSSRM